MYDLYYMGTLLHHFDEKEFSTYCKEIQHVFSDAHWEELFNVPVSRELVFVRDTDHKVLFTLIKDLQCAFLLIANVRSVILPGVVNTKLINALRS